MTFAVLQVLVSSSVLVHFDSGYLSLHVLKICICIHHIVLWLLYLLDNVTMGKCNIFLNGWTGYFMPFYTIFSSRVCHRKYMKYCKCYLVQSFIYSLLHHIHHDIWLTDDFSCKRHCINTVNCTLAMKTYMNAIYLQVCELLLSSLKRFN